MEYCFCYDFSLPELARDCLNGLGKYSVEGGIISPVHDAYGKKVSVVLLPRLLVPTAPLKTSRSSGCKHSVVPDN